MQILTNNTVVFTKGEKIERGRWENDLTMDTYRITTDTGYQYAVIADFGLHMVASVPEDFEPNKYCYTEEKGFYLNPDWEPQRYDEASQILTQKEEIENV